MLDGSIPKQDAAMPLSENADTWIRRHVSPGSVWTAASPSGPLCLRHREPPLSLRPDRAWHSARWV